MFEDRLPSFGDTWAKATLSLVFLGIGLTLDTSSNAKIPFKSQGVVESEEKISVLQQVPSE